MTSLTNISIASRKIIRYGIYILVFLIVGRIFLSTGIKIYKKLFPSPPPPPTVKYGKLTKIPFPDNGITAKPSYVLETADGNLPNNIPTQAKVYFMPKTSANLLSLDAAKSKAAAMGFSADTQKLSDTIYKFKNPDTPAYLQMNIISGTFSISYDLTADASPIDQTPPVAEVAANDFKETLSQANLLPPDLTGPVTHDFLKVVSGQLTSAMSLSEADFIKINLFRKNYNELPAMTGNPNQANIWAIVSGARGRGQEIIASEYHYRAIDESQFSTYPIRPVSEAFSALQEGKAFIASLGLNKEGDSIKIRHIYLAYFDPDATSEYYQPIYVFEGDNGFTAYLPAVSLDYYQAE